MDAVTAREQFPHDFQADARAAPDHQVFAIHLPEYGAEGHPDGGIAVANGRLSPGTAAELPPPLQKESQFPARFITKAPKRAMASPRASCSRRVSRASPWAEAKASETGSPRPILS